jgi:hypothetical protein
MASQMLQHAQILAAFAMKAPDREISYDLAGHLGYLADRLCLERHNFPVVADRRVSVMGSAVDCGVMRTVFDGFNPEVRGQAMFSEVGPLSCRLSDHVIDEDLDLHSVTTAGIIAEVWLQYGALGVEGIMEAMSDGRRFPEIPAHGLGEDISVAAILQAIGFDDAADIAIEIEAHERLDLIFSILEIR